MPEGSNWVIVQVHRHKYNPLEGGSWIDLPPEFKNPKYGLVNMKNKDNECFRWCHIRRFNPQEKYPQGIKKEDKLLVDNYDYSGVDFPVKDKHYSRIEAQNNINVNIFGYDNKQFYPIYVTTGSHEELNLLLISDGEKLHYVLIKSFNSLMHNKTKHKDTKHFYMHCLQAFSSKEILITKHKENCLSINGIQMPKKGSKV